jgi:hypothetical protein
MLANPPVASSNKLENKTYFSWAGKLWYIVEIDKTGEMVFIEDCKTERVRWVKTALFEDDMKEVKLTELC